MITTTTHACSVPGCPNSPLQGTMCSTHRTRRRKGQPLDAPILTPSQRAQLAGYARGRARRGGPRFAAAQWATSPCAWCGTAAAQHDRCGLCGMLTCARDDYGPPAEYCRSCQRVRAERRRDRVTATPMVTIAIGRQEDL